jgi:hypothetical protein
VIGCAFVVLLGNMAWGAQTASPTPPASFGPTLHPFLEKHCSDCHDETEQKGGLRLDNLSFDLSKSDVARTWIDVFDKVSNGEMPPKKRPRPPVDQTNAALASLKSNLTAADLARRGTNGRVMLRRLNRTEYQNTIRDLLHVDVDVKDLLPEDTSSMGFDNIASALSVSSVLMDRYLEAADMALDAAIQSGPRPKTQTWDVAYGVVTNNPNDYRIKSGNRTLPDGTFIIFNSGDVPVVCDRFKAPMEGRYHFKVTTYAYHSPNTPLTFDILAGSFDPKLPRRHTVGFYDALPDHPQTIEFTDDLPKNGTFKIMIRGTGRHYFKDGDQWKTYDGPGVAVSRVQAEGPLLTAWPPQSQTDLFGSLDLAAAKASDAPAVLLNFAQKAFRRPVATAEIDPYVALVKARLDSGETLELAIRVGLKAILCSPEFLFLHEQPGRLDDFAIASRLSYFLWSSTPDDQLLKAAASHTLRDPKVLRAQTERLLNDARSAAFTENFTGQWLMLRQIDFTSPDKRLYPEFDDLLQWSSLEETHRFFNELLANNLSLVNFIDSDFSILNGRLAELYGIPGVTGTSFQKVTLPPDCHRGGVLTQSAVLKVTANGTNTSPVVRGAWVMRNIMGQPPKPQPPNIPAIEPDVRGATTIREQLEKHRSNTACSSCHTHMDPPGCALESFDVIGGWRENYRSLGGKETIKVQVDGKTANVRKGLVVDPSATLADGRSFKNFDEFRKLLVADKTQFARCLTEKLMVYSTGGGLDFADRPAVDRILQELPQQNYGFRSLIHDVVESDTFLTK